MRLRRCEVNTYTSRRVEPSSKRPIVQPNRYYLLRLLMNETLTRLVFSVTMLSLVVVPTRETVAQQTATGNAGTVVRSLLDKYTAERKASGKVASHQFSAKLFSRADAKAQKASELMLAGRLKEATELAREALWSLPNLPAELPEHVARVYGSLKLRHSGLVTAIVYSSDGKRLATACSDGLVRIWDPESGNQLRLLHDRRPRLVTAIAFSPNGQWLAAADEGKRITIWEVENGKEVSSFAAPQGAVETIAFSPDGKSIACGGTAQKIFVHEVPSGKLRFELPPTSANGRQPAAHTPRVHAVAYSPDGRWIVSAGGNGTARLWKAEEPSPSVLSVQAQSGPISQLAFSPDSQDIAACGDDDVVKILSLTGMVKQTLRLPSRGAGTCFAFSKDGRSLVAGGKDRAIRFWDISSGRLLRTLTGHQAEVIALALSPAGDQIGRAHV